MKLVLAAVACLALAFPAGAQVYKWTDSAGKVHYGDKPPEDAKASQVKVDAVSSHDGPPQVDNWAAIIRRPTNVESLKPKPTSAGITMYSTSWCGYCKKARLFFAEKKIAYRDVDIEASKAGMEEYKGYGGKGVPLFISGERRMRGFTDAAMDKFLASAR